MNEGIDDLDIEYGNMALGEVYISIPTSSSLLKVHECNAIYEIYTLVPRL